MHTMSRIEGKAQDVDRLFQAFRQQQTTLGGAVTPEDKQELRRRLDALNDELNHYLAAEYGVEMKKRGAYAQWLATHQPFHWFVEFYGIMQRGGFDVIIGNPPYVEYSKVRKEYTVKGYTTEKNANLYAFSIERSLGLVRATGHFSMIVPMSLVSTAKMAETRDLLMRDSSYLYYSHYSGDAHPSVLFSGVKMRLSIIIVKRSAKPETTPELFTTSFLRWYADARPQLFDSIQYQNISPDTLMDTLVPKIGSSDHLRILNKLFAQSKHIRHFVVNSGQHSVYAHRIVAHFVKSFDFVPYFWNERDGKKKSEDYKVFSFQSSNEALLASALLNSTTFYYFYLTYSDAYHCGRELILAFPCDLKSIECDQNL